MKKRKTKAAGKAGAGSNALKSARTAKKTKLGAPFGAERLAFALTPGSGRVKIATRIQSIGRVAVAIPEGLKKTLRAASYGKRYTPAMVGLAGWALDELKRRGKDIEIRDADRAKSEKRKAKK